MNMIVLICIILCCVSFVCKDGFFQDIHRIDIFTLPRYNIFYVNTLMNVIGMYHDVYCKTFATDYPLYGIFIFPRMLHIAKFNYIGCLK